MGEDSLDKTGNNFLVRNKVIWAWPKLYKQKYRAGLDHICRNFNLCASLSLSHIRLRACYVTYIIAGALVKIPKAWIDEKARSIHDHGAAVRALQKAAVDAARKSLKDSDEIIEATIDVYLPSSIRKARNRAAVLVEATKDFRDDHGSTDDAEAETVIEEDWLNVFSRYAEDASSERLQFLFGKILAGEIRRPGSVSPSTLRIIAELDQEMASDLQFVSAYSVGTAILKLADWKDNDWREMISRLEQGGFITQSLGGGSTWTYTASSPEQIGIIWFDDIGFSYRETMKGEFKLEVLILTKIGQQIIKLIAPAAGQQLLYRALIFARSKNATATDVVIIDRQNNILQRAW